MKWPRDGSDYGIGTAHIDRIARLQRLQRPVQHEQWEGVDVIGWLFVGCIVVIFGSLVAIGLMLGG